MHKITVWVENHPYMAGSLVVGIIVLWIIIRNRSAAASTDTSGVVYSGPSDALQAAELQTGASISQAQLAAQAQMYGYDAAVRGQALSDAATVAQAAIAGGVTDNQTAAQLQYGLAQYGFSPSVSPYGQTIPIGGSSSSVYSPLKPPTSYPGPGYTWNGTKWVYTGTTTSYTGGTQSPTSPGPGYTWDGVSWRYTGTTGSTGSVYVPSVPIYGPVDSSGNPTILGVTSPGSIPSSSGLTWQQYYPQVDPSRYTSVSFAPASIAAATAASVAAQNDYIYNPLSCHNVVC